MLNVTPTGDPATINLDVVGLRSAEPIGWLERSRLRPPHQVVEAPAGEPVPT